MSKVAIETNDDTIEITLEGKSRDVAGPIQAEFERGNPIIALIDASTIGSNTIYLVPTAKIDHIKVSGYKADEDGDGGIDKAGDGELPAVPEV